MTHHSSSPQPLAPLPLGMQTSVSSELQIAQDALRASLRRARRLDAPSTLCGQVVIPAAVSDIPGIARHAAIACPVIGDDLVLWLGDRGRARKLAKAMRVLMLRLAEPKVRLRIAIRHRLLAMVRPRRSTKLDSDLRMGLLPLVRRMRVDFRHVHNLRSSSDEERSFIVTVLTRHALKSLRQLDAHEIDQVRRSLNSDRGLIDTALCAMRQRLAELSGGDACTVEAAREASMVRSTQGIQALNCLKEALTAALA